jgi:2,3-diketo-5-methylthio-1-phosphopentane phosphatase
MSKQRHTIPKLFLDFDGTISERDVIDAILEKYADERWLVYESKWRAGQIGSRACLAAQMELVRATRRELDLLVDSIELDEGLSDLLQFCARHQIPTHIVSDGFDYCINRLLSRITPGLIVRVCASHLEPKGREQWHVTFPFFSSACAHGCATCKPAVMSLLNMKNAPSIFVGDGLSDRYAAAAADVVFAKKGLATYCSEEQLPYLPYETLSDVKAHLETGLGRERYFLIPESIELVGA